MATTTIASLRHVSKRFQQTWALNGVDLEIRPGQIHGLLGANGSGKSTLVKVLSGYHMPEPGAQIEINGAQLQQPYAAADAFAAGVSVVHQDLGLLPDLSIAENFRLSYLATRAGAWIKWADVRQAASLALAEFGVQLDVRASVGSLTPIDRAIVAIVRALAATGTGTDTSIGAGAGSPTRSSSGKPRLLILDEPSAYLDARALDILSGFLHDVASARGGVLLVSHHLDEVKALTSYISVLRDGEVVANGATEEFSSADLFALIAGTAVMPRNAPSPDAGAAPLRRALVQSALPGTRARKPRSLARGATFVIEQPSTGNSLSCELAAGDIVGITGQRDAGWESVPYELFGVVPSRGELTVDGKKMDLRRMMPTRAIKNGIGLVPLNRVQHGALEHVSIGENLAMNDLQRFMRRGTVRTAAIRENGRKVIERYGIRASNAGQPLATLSGGNQQKVVLAKWIELAPRLLLLDNPTQGVDVAAREQIHEMLAELAARGTSVLLCSSDFTELVRLTDRVLIIHDGEEVDRLVGERLGEHEILQATLGAN